MQNQVKSKLPNSAIVFQAVDGKEHGKHPGVHAHEIDEGSFMFNSLQKQFEETLGEITINDAFARIYEDVTMEAQDNGKVQTPRMIVHGDASGREQILRDVFLKFDEVLFLAPVYDQRPDLQGFPRLIGAQHDVSQILKEACKGNIFSPECKITAMCGLMFSFYDRPGLSIVETSQVEARIKLNEMFKGNKNVGIFIFSHGAYDDQKKDEYLVFPESKHAPLNRIYNMDLARMLVSKEKGFVFLFADYCFSHDFENDIKQALEEMHVKDQELVVARGSTSRAYNRGRTHRSFVQEKILDKAEQTVAEFALFRLAGQSIGPMNPAVEATINRAILPLEQQAMRQMFPEGDIDGMTGFTRGSLPPVSSYSVRSIESASDGDYDPSAPFSTVSVAQVIAPVEAVPVDENQAPPAAGQVRERALGEAVEALTSFWHDLPNQISMAWDMVEAGSGYLFGTGILSYVLPWLIVAILVTAGAALWLYVRYIAHHQQGSFVMMLLVMAVTSMLPYLCDPILLQKFFSAENSVFVGLACTGASFVVLVITVAFNWRKISSNVSAVFKATSLASKYSMIARLALEMHLFDAGRGVQQTVHIRVGGIDRFVMYYPLMTNGTHPICPVRLTNDMVKHLPSGTGFTVLNKKLGENQWADVTCMGSVMKRQVLNHTGGDIEMIKSLSFDHGKHVLDLEGLHMDSKYLMHRFRVNTTGWEDHPVLSKVALAEQLPDAWKNDASFAIQLPTLTKKSKATTVELLAEPFLFSIEKLVGISLSALRVPRSSEL